MNTELTPKETSELLRHIINTNIKLAEQGKHTVSVCIEGQAGISKSSIVKELSSEKDFHFIRLNMAEMDSTGDLTGFPITQYSMSKNNETIWISDRLFNYYGNLGYKPTNESRMSYAKPEWLVGKEDKPVILLLDDYNRGLNMILQAAMRIVDEQGYVSWELPKGSTVILTTNPSGDDFLITEMDSAQSSRFLLVKMKASVENWASWAEGKVDERCINFLLKTKEVIEIDRFSKNEDASKTKANLRIWTKFFDSISTISDFNHNWNLIFNLGQNSIPIDHLMLFNTFIKDKLDKLPTVENILNNDIDKTLETLSKITKDRVDLSSLISKRLLNYFDSNYKNFTPSMLSNYVKILESSILNKDLTFFAIKEINKKKPDVILKNEKLREKLLV